MVEEDRYCADIITQVASVQEALRGVARNLMKNHLHHCAAKALRSEKKEETEAMYDELLELILRHICANATEARGDQQMSSQNPRGISSPIMQGRRAAGIPFAE